jgi:nucleoside-diphosphate-sugar epimerase
VKRVLVTGAGGFLGRRLIPALSNAGLSVVAGSRARNRDLPPYVEFRQIPDLRARVDWGPLIADVDYVVHLAGIAHAVSSIPSSIYEQVNYRATEALANAARSRGVERLLFMSSVRAQCGATSDHVLTERDSPRPTDHYGESKLAAEEAIASSGAPFTILRPTLIYGAGVKGNMAQLVRLASLPAPLPFARLTNLRSFLAVENLFDAVQYVLRSDSALNETYLIADTTPVTVGQVIAALREGAGRRHRLFGVPDQWLSTALRIVGRADVWQRLGGTLVVDPAKLLATGWRPRVETLASLRQLAAESSAQRGTS